MTRRLLIAGNWKMHGTSGALAFFADPGINRTYAGIDRLICPPATLLRAATEAASATGVMIGGQDCHAQAGGAHTGDVSAEMLADAGASHVIVGHSERRADHGERDATVKAKAEAALRAGLTPIVCVGESRADREAGREFDVVGEQLAGSWPDGGTGDTVVIAYEPVWAIGTGLTASIGDIDAMHAFIREARGGDQSLRILYGGSVKPANSGDILGRPEVDGALIGGASLTAESFAAICLAAAD
ncbi:triose-phosphate isomerase [Hyphobacterium marinum]|uniref:Triosephosphate isomerase n=1 Tax=Hyphobacterium marinum TaxID=3116574 RepID=A0ABU7M118_9PROT|nr:triose-phosphate isomerase [Hyphobacterium sp. Y6023]MEE2567513.1 triose-phosphate isomerase [Hyphobacterium sp. Y6023]